MCPTMNYMRKIRPAILLKIHHDVEMDPQDGKSSCEREKASFCSRFNTNLPRLEADRRSKSKQSLKSMPLWPEPKVMNATSCHSNCHRNLCSDELYCALTNQVLPLLEQLTL